MKDVSLEVYRALEEQSNEQQGTLFDGDLMLTDKARIAKEILSDAKLAITLDERRTLEGQSKEQEKSQFGEFKMPTDRAKEAKKILSEAKLAITLSKMKELQEQDEAKRMLSTEELVIIPDKIREKDNVFFSTKQIGQATINTPTSAKNEATQVENNENTRIGAKEGEEFGYDN